LTVSARGNGFLHSAQITSSDPEGPAPGLAIVGAPVAPPRALALVCELLAAAPARIALRGCQLAIVSFQTSVSG